MTSRFSKNPSKLIDKSVLDLFHFSDEHAIFHDPYSELTLFLSQKIKRELHHCSNSKKWSVKLQNELLLKITPEFQKQFPKYRLGISSLKKTWERVRHVSSQIQDQKEALTQDGKLNLAFFIKENLKRSNHLKHTCNLHPYHFAHQLAIKMGECIAVVDGIRPKLDQLTRTIWSLQRHLLPNLGQEDLISPYDENERIDKLIVKSILEVSSKHHQISQAELKFYVQNALQKLKDLTEEYSQDKIKKMLIAFFADQCHTPSAKMEKILENIPYPVPRCLKNELAQKIIDTPDVAKEEIIQNALEFFYNAHMALKDTSPEEIKRKVHNWTIQSDMLLRMIKLSHTSALYLEIVEQLRQNPLRDLHKFINVVHRQFLEKYPKLIVFAKEVEMRSWLFLKYYWYTQQSLENISTYDHFIHWHRLYLSPLGLTSEQLAEKIENISKKMVPLIPFKG